MNICFIRSYIKNKMIERNGMVVGLNNNLMLRAGGVMPQLMSSLSTIDLVLFCDNFDFTRFLVLKQLKHGMIYFKARI